MTCELSEDLMWSECPSSHRCVPRRCVLPYTQFSVSKEDYYSLQPDRDLSIHRMVPLAQHGEELGGCLSSVCRSGQGPGGGLE